jgi:hypothetical protein
MFCLEPVLNHSRIEDDWLDHCHLRGPQQWKVPTLIGSKILRSVPTQFHQFINSATNSVPWRSFLFHAHGVTNDVPFTSVKRFNRTHIASTVLREIVKIFPRKFVENLGKGQNGQGNDRQNKPKWTAIESRIGASRGFLDGWNSELSGWCRADSII